MSDKAAMNVRVFTPGLLLGFLFLVFFVSSCGAPKRAIPAITNVAPEENHYDEHRFTE